MALSSVPPLRSGLMRILLVRHGESILNQRGVLDNREECEFDSLTDAGKAQATSLGVALRESTLSSQDLYGAPFVGSSSMVRAIETADLVAKEAFPSSIRLPPIDALRENLNGNLEGRAIKEIGEELKSISAAWSRGEADVRVGETGDSPKTLQERASVGLKSLLDAVPSEASIVLVGAHFWVNRVLLARWLGKDLSQLNEISQPNASISVVDIDRSDPWNGTVHLVGYQVPVADRAES